MSVTAPRGFRAAGVTAGLKPSGKKDLALVVNDGPQFASASVFTSNRCKANPVLWSQEVVKDGVVRAVVLNSGGANCYTGAEGFQTTHAVAERVADGLGIGAVDVVVCSTGLIGLTNDRDVLVAGVDEALGAIGPDGGQDAATAIMTTDTVSKQVVVEGSGWSIGGMAKGAGMLAPQLATMLVVLTTDAVVDAATADRALRAATRVSFDRLDSDGCMSTNDTVTLMASGASGITPTEEDFAEALGRACTDLAMQLLADAEGADHDIAITVLNAATRGRGGRGRPLDRPQRPVQDRGVRQGPQLGPRARLHRYDGRGVRPGRPRRRDERGLGLPEVHARRGPRLVDMEQREVTVTVDLKAGDARATVWTNDLTHAYVHENSAYSS